MTRPRPPPSPVAKRMSGKVIVSDKRIDFGYFYREGCSIGEWIKATGCESLYYMSERYNPHLIHEFYSYMAQGNGWIAKVKGVKIPVTAEMLRRV